MIFAKPAMAAVAFWAIVCPIGSQADPVVGNCSPARVKYVASDALAFKTISSSYIDLAQARVSFRQGGNTPSCVLVRFSANANGDQSNFAIRALLDGAELALPNELVVTDGADKGPAARRFTFVLPSVSPGSHTVAIQYRRLNGTDGRMNAHNTIVWFGP